MAKQNSNLQILDTVRNPSRQVEPGIDPRKKREARSDKKCFRNRHILIIFYHKFG